MFYHPFDVFFSLFFIHPFSPNVSQSFFLRLKVSFSVFLQVLHTSEVSGIRPVSNHEDLTWEQREPGLQKPHLTSKLACTTEQERHLHQEEEEGEYTRSRIQNLETQIFVELLILFFSFLVKHGGMLSLMNGFLDLEWALADCISLSV
jgi:hypothetical protein